MYDIRQFIGNWFVLESSGRAVAMCTREEDAALVSSALNTNERHANVKQQSEFAISQIVELVKEYRREFPSQHTLQGLLSFVEWLHIRQGKRSHLAHANNSRGDEIIRLLDCMSADDRMDVFGKYCMHCGDKNPRCQCWNDE